MSDSNKKAPYSSLCIFGDKDGAILQTLLQLQKEGRLPDELSIMHVTGYSEKSADMFQKSSTQLVLGEVTWPNVLEYQPQTL